MPEVISHVEKALEYRLANQGYLQRWASLLFNICHAWDAEEKGNYGVAEKMNYQLIARKLRPKVH
jgi:hypothetical protein